MKPLNKHVMIKPVELTEFIVSDKGVYQEIGEVLAVADEIGGRLKIGTRVYFDSWLAKKYPVEGSSDEFIWFVNFDDIVAYETVPE